MYDPQLSLGNGLFIRFAPTLPHDARMDLLAKVQAEPDHHVTRKMTPKRGLYQWIAAGVRNLLRDDSPEDPRVRDWIVRVTYVSAGGDTVHFDCGPMTCAESRMPTPGMATEIERMRVGSYAHSHPYTRAIRLPSQSTEPMDTVAEGVE